MGLRNLLINIVISVCTKFSFKYVIFADKPVMDYFNGQSWVFMGPYPRRFWEMEDNRYPAQITRNVAAISIKYSFIQIQVEEILTLKSEK